MYKFLSEMSLYNFCDKYYADEEGNVYFSDSEKNKEKFKNKKVKPFINKYGYVEYIYLQRGQGRKSISKLIGLLLVYL
jgi:phage pi2 protein 07